MDNIKKHIGEDRVFDGHYKLIQQLSADGATADVWLALDMNTIDKEIDEDISISGHPEDSGLLVAIKIYRPKNALDIEGEQRFRDEFKTVFECRHENLLQPTTFSVFEDIPYLVLPYCKAGSAEKLVGKKLDSDEIWKFVSDVSAGLAKLHSNCPQIIHQDIKPANILIDSSNNYTITDFGISSTINGKHGHYYYDDDNSGTLAYMAPERFDNNTTPNPESDVWAFGATLYEIITGKVPFGEEGGKNQTNSSDMPTLSNCPHDIRNLIFDCLQKNPKKRPTAHQIFLAAQAKHYPLKKKVPWYITIGLLSSLLIGIVTYYLLREPVSSPKIVQEEYDKALCLLNVNNVDTLKKGLRIMDSLSNANYIPAMYQIAFTYGFYKDSISLQRKHLLGIQITENKFPKEDKYNVKTKELLNRILDEGDSAYAVINAEAAYRLACYYGERWASKDNDNKMNVEEVYGFLDKAEFWSQITNDTSMQRKISDARIGIEKNKLRKEKTSLITNY